MALGLTQPLTEVSTRKCFWEVKRGRRVRLTTSPPSVSRVTRKFEIPFEGSQPYRLPRPVTEIDFIVTLVYNENLRYKNK
jgi:hypothetical protein